ncbi:uncharacterized protein LOC127251087 [Andrographis paniculata]|uniref:uncharacterized protein LOC127251087 n=1 Tax=Andrographis paniculata TaxID=175694 RepID=UPI0021E8E4CD|nr:uncharacterized protein LOC127251087 [Andrographis paniculata]
MASISVNLAKPAVFAANSARKPSAPCSSADCRTTAFLGSKISFSRDVMLKNKQRKQMTVVAAAGDVSANGTTYLIAGAVAIALIGTAFPILFQRKDLCPECDGAGFVRKSGSTLRANAARKDQVQIVCARCNGLGKLNQIDKVK